MKSDTKAIWIKLGYETFALKGQGALKIERLAKQVGKSKSSFYHHFADIDSFIETLLKHHIDQSYVIADQERTANKIDPDLINVLLAHQTDLLFNRQLRINQNVKLFNDTLCRSNKIVGEAFKTVWVKDLNLKLNDRQMEGIFTLALQNFYLQINVDTLNPKWLSEYFLNLKRIANSFT
ncbi:MAG: TetR/AcrR family transcriptional regulator [Cyclobacteriaceae bacterium]|jgi:AcrR family transcriptional regulator|nr:TetR/AcrR family transcriptional regulator [Cyclobacteriaceae bacterium]